MKGVFTVRTAKGVSRFHNIWTDEGIAWLLHSSFDLSQAVLPVDHGYFIVPFRSSSFHSSISTSMVAADAPNSSALYILESAWATAGAQPTVTSVSTEANPVVLSSTAVNRSVTSSIYGIAFGIWSYANPGSDVDPWLLLAISGQGGSFASATADENIDITYNIHTFNEFG